MNVKKGVSAPRKGQTSLPQTLAHVIFFHIFFTQASTPSLRGPAIGFKHHDREAIVSVVVNLLIDSQMVMFSYLTYTNKNEVTVVQQRKKNIP